MSILLIVMPFGILTSGLETKTNRSLSLNALFPNLNFSTFFGGNSTDIGLNIAISTDGSCYVIGDTYSPNFPTKNAYNSTYGGMKDVFIAKFTSNGSLLWSTYFGGSDEELGKGIAVANDGSCYVIGYTESTNFPTLNAYNNTHGSYGNDAFLAKFSSSGSLLWSTFLGGDSGDYGENIALTADGSCYVIGYTSSENFPTLNSYDDTYGGSYYGDAFVSKFSSTGSILWSTYLGGETWEHGWGITTANDGSCYVTGTTSSNDFPIWNAYDGIHSGFQDAFISKFSVNGSLLMSTFLGGSEDEDGYGIAVGNDGSYSVTGWTDSDNFPTLNAYDSTFNGFAGEYGGDTFATQFSSTGSLLWSTYLGGSDRDEARDVAIDTNGNSYLIGGTKSNDFPTLNAYDKSYNGINDAFITKLSINGSILWSTYLGASENDLGYGIAISDNDNCYMIGGTHSSNFPTLNAYNSTYSGTNDAFIAKFIETTTSPGRLSAYSFLGFVVVMPLLMLLLRKRRI